jgi:hypothetical protein
MDVDGVRPAAPSVGKSPFLYSTALGSCQNSLIHLRPCDSIDLPLAVAALELEVVLCGRVWRRKGDLAQGPWERGVKVV